jgi:transcriptional regulator with XRE-family HTH domain
MENLNKQIGKRLREIRNIANEGTKLSARQFAHLLNETTDKILNYENGRAAVSVQLLINLYNRGFNPVYILTGEGSKFADNDAGITLKNKLSEMDDTRKPHELNTDNNSIEELIKKAREFNVAAGNILESLEKKKGI